MSTQLTDNIALLVAAPNGIQKLRGLILKLAIRGSLVPRDPNDEPASGLLIRIAKERSRLLAKGEIRQLKALAEIPTQDLSVPIPIGWEWVRLGTLVLNILSGGTPSKSNPEFWDGDIPWASVKDLNVIRDLITTQDFITQKGLDAGSKLACKGDVLVCTRMGLGKIAIATMDVAINQDLKALKLTRNIDVDYFLNYYKTLSIVGSGMTVAGIRQDELLGYLVPLPPLPEQKRIVAKVDELMALCDRLEDRLHEARRVQEDLADTLVKQAVT